MYYDNLLSKIDADFFLYTWESIGPQRVTDDGSFNEYCDLYHPKYHQIDTPAPSLEHSYKRIVSTRRFTRTDVQPKAVVYQAYQRWICNKMRKSRGEYDTCIVTRPDIIPSEPFNPEVLEYAKDSLLIPIGSDWVYGICDLLAIGPPHYIDIYCSLYESLYTYARKGVLFHPEHLLKYHLSKYNVPIKRFSYTIHIDVRRMT